MKKIFLTGILLATAFTFTVAQQSEIGRAMTNEAMDALVEQHLQAEVDTLTVLLSLSAEQQTKIHAVEVELTKIRSEKTMKVLGDTYAQMVILLEDQQLREEKYRPVLSAEQFEKFLEYNAQRKKEQEALVKRFQPIQN